MTSVDANTLNDSASGSLGQAHRAADPAIKEGKRQAGVLLDQSRDLVDRATRRASETAAEMGKNVIAASKKNPLTALLLAVGAGVILVIASKSMQSRR
jgi:hypothetical protein